MYWGLVRRFPGKNRKEKSKTYVVPVSLTLLESGALEAESALPRAGLGGILGERELAVVAVPRAEKVDSLAVGGGAEREVELDRGHYC